MTSNIRAILVCLLAYVCFDLMAVHVRILSVHYSPQELSVYRNVMGILPTIAFLAYTRELSLNLDAYKIKQWKLAFGRGLLVALAQLLFYTALANLELATVSALGQTNAVFVVLIAIIFYREKVGFWRWGAIAIGFTGAILLAAISVELSPIQSIEDGLLIFSMSICGGFGVIFLMFAFRNAPAAVLAPFSYFGIITAFCFGWFIFGEFPVDTLFPGVFLIIFSGLTILWREQRKKN